MATATRDKATARFEKIWAEAQQSQKTSVSQAQQSIKSDVSVSSSNYLPQHFAKGVAELADACLAQKLIDGTQHAELTHACDCLLYTSPSPRDLSTSRMPSSA